MRYPSEDELNDYREQEALEKWESREDVDERELYCPNDACPAARREGEDEDENDPKLVTGRFSWLAYLKRTHRQTLETEAEWEWAGKDENLCEVCGTTGQKVPANPDFDLVDEA